jgi:hypothetical protein
MKKLVNTIKTIFNFSKEKNFFGYPVGETTEISVMERAMLGGF